MLRMEDVGELAYGGLVTGLKRWDAGRAIDSGDIFKKASFWGYLVPGLIATTATAMNWMPRYSAWNERLAHGFIYGFPNFVMELVDSFGEGAGSTVQDAERFLRERAQTRSRKDIGQSTKPGFEDIEIH